MIELTAKDKLFKDEVKPENLILAAIALETVDHVRSEYGQDGQNSIVTTLMSILGLKSTEIESMKIRPYEHRLASMLSDYVLERLKVLDNEPNRDVADWLRKMAA